MLYPIEYKDVKLKGNLFAAPLAGYTNLPTRLFLSSFGADATFTEMVSADGIVHGDEKTLSLLDTDAKETSAVPQIFGNDGAVLKEAIEIIRDTTPFRIVNLNCGCPVKKILKSKKGGYLLKDEERLKNIIRTLGDIKGIAVTLKIRAGWDENHLNYLKVGAWAREFNMKLLIFHGRTVMQGFRSSANWEWIRELKESLDMPVIGNGDIITAAGAWDRLENFRVDGLMIGRGFLGNPWIFQDIKRFKQAAGAEAPAPEDRKDIMIRHLKMMIAYLGERKGVLQFRKQMFPYLKNFPNSARLRKRLALMESFSSIEKACEEFFT